MEIDFLDREYEIRELKKSVQRSKDYKDALVDKIQELKVQINC